MKFVGGKKQNRYLIKIKSNILETNILKYMDFLKDFIILYISAMIP